MRSDWTRTRVHKVLQAVQQHFGIPVTQQLVTTSEERVVADHRALCSSYGIREGVELYVSARTGTRALAPTPPAQQHSSTSQHPTGPPPSSAPQLHVPAQRYRPTCRAQSAAGAPSVWDGPGESVTTFLDMYGAAL
eukprot:TRINITY_DN44400_c0_g1_i1.p3 TRINITY_DN44400_c0_g1~~TRINITY_DN44400_c0_g1_i1.p3  ORF type:complete len:136 (+),score=21.16 TRINITY_DN44400_c0_g1_i1:1048-1455(+)